MENDKNTPDINSPQKEDKSKGRYPNEVIVIEDDRERRDGPGGEDGG